LRRSDEVLLAHVLRRVLRSDPRVVDEDVDATEVRKRRPDGSLDDVPGEVESAADRWLAAE